MRERDWMMRNSVPKEERLPGLWPQYEDGLLTVRKQGDSYFITRIGPYTNVLLIRKSELQRLIALLQRVEEETMNEKRTCDETKPLSEMAGWVGGDVLREEEVRRMDVLWEEREKALAQRCAPTEPLAEDEEARLYTSILVRCLRDHEEYNGKLTEDNIALRRTIDTLTADNAALKEENKELRGTGTRPAENEAPQDTINASDDWHFEILKEAWFPEKVDPTIQIYKLRETKEDIQALPGPTMEEVKEAFVKCEALQATVKGQKESIKDSQAARLACEELYAEAELAYDRLEAKYEKLMLGLYPQCLAKNEALEEELRAERELTSSDCGVEDRQAEGVAMQAEMMASLRAEKEALEERYEARASCEEQYAELEAEYKALEKRLDDIMEEM